MEFPSLYNHVVVRNMSLEEAVLLWFEYKGEESYSIYAKEQQKKNLIVEGKYRTQTSKIRSILKVMIRLNENDTKQPTSLICFDVKKDSDQNKWKKEIKLVIKSCVGQINEYLINNKLIKPKNVLTRNMVSQHIRKIEEHLHMNEIGKK